MSFNQIDAIVVGAGPGGATVAKELSLKNKKVLMLEWGDNAPLTGKFGKSLLLTRQLQRVRK